MERPVLSELARQLGVDEGRLGRILRELAEEEPVALRLMERYVSAEVGRVEEAVRSLREIMEERFREGERRLEDLKALFEERFRQSERRLE